MNADFRDDMGWKSHAFSNNIMGLIGKYFKVMKVKRYSVLANPTSAT